MGANAKENLIKAVCDADVRVVLLNKTPDLLDRRPTVQDMLDLAESNAVSA